ARAYPRVKAALAAEYDADKFPDRAGLVCDIVAKHPYRSRCGQQHRGDDLHESGLARPIGAEQAVHLALLDLNGYLVESDHLGGTPRLRVAPGQVLHIDRQHVDLSRVRATHTVKLMSHYMFEAIFTKAATEVSTIRANGKDCLRSRA